jgi:hypothetical protein
MIENADGIPDSDFERKFFEADPVQLRNGVTRKIQ